MSGAGVAMAAAAAVANAIKASGSLVELEAEEFLKLVNRSKDAPVVSARGGFLNKKYRYLSVYHGLFIYTTSSEALNLPSDIELITAKSIHIPS